MIRACPAALQNLHLFDNITFIDGDYDHGTIVAIHIKASGIHEVTDRHFPWFDTHSAFSVLANPL